MIKNKNFEETWATINEMSVFYMDEDFDVVSGELIAFLLNNLLSKDKFEIGVHRTWMQKSSSIYYKEPKKQLELRGSKNNSYTIILSFHDADNKLFVFKHKLTKEETSLIPEWLRKGMQNIRELERPITIYNPLK